MKKSILLLFTILFMVACQSGDKVQTVNIENRYTISLPSFLVSVNYLNDDASLQYQNMWKEFYVIVIDEPKKELEKALIENELLDEYSTDIDGYTSLLLDNFEETIDISEVSSITTTRINNMPARLLSILGSVDEIEIFYDLAFVEGKDAYYQIMCWCLPGKRDKYKEQMQQIIYSLQEL